jgi:hypothetical protein
MPPRNKNAPSTEYDNLMKRVEETQRDIDALVEKSKKRICGGKTFYDLTKGWEEGWDSNSFPDRYQPDADADWEKEFDDYVCRNGASKKFAKFHRLVCTLKFNIEVWKSEADNLIDEMVLLMKS